jgi:transcriptional regulator with XRE-family HTH domain
MDKERKSMINKWSHLKRQIRDRQLLAYIIGISAKDINTYMCSSPPNEEIKRIEEIILNDRKEKTERIKKELSKIIGYRESVEMSKRIGVSDTLIRNIMSEEEKFPSYEVIDKIELFINALKPEFELSLENTLTISKHVNNEVDEIIMDIYRVYDGLVRFSVDLKIKSKKMKLDKDIWDATIPLNSLLDRYINLLKDVSVKLNYMSDNYFKNSNKSEPVEDYK